MSSYTSSEPKRPASIGADGAHPNRNPWVIALACLFLGLSILGGVLFGFGVNANDPLASALLISFGDAAATAGAISLMMFALVNALRWKPKPEVADPSGSGD